MFSLRTTLLRSPRLKRGLPTATPTQRNFHIPIINFARFRNAISDADKREIAGEVVGALKGSGFMYLSHHGIADEVIERAFAKSAEFFALPSESKDKLAWEDPRSNRGYVQIGRERVTQSASPDEIAALRAKAPDFKESMEIGRDWGSEWANRWPAEGDVPGFKAGMLAFFQTCHELQLLVMRSVALGLRLPERFFDDKVDEQSHNLRLLSYPSIRTSRLDGEDQARAGAHSDYGTLTLLFQDRVGGLQVQDPNTQIYHPAPPIPGTIVINVGDLLSRWSNNVLRSTLHRVVAPPSSASETDDLGVPTVTPARQSIAFFSNPNFSADIECLPTCVGEEGALYPGVRAGEYIVGRLAVTYV